MKELFCGSPVMTWVAASMFQSPVSQPDDLMESFDYLKPENQDVIMRQLERDDPWVTIVAWSHGPLCRWARFQLGRGGIGAAKVKAKRKMAQGLLDFSAKVARHRLERSRLVLMENPWVMLRVLCVCMQMWG